MNKRYIDFVPTSQKKSVETGASAGAGAYRAMPQKQAGVGKQRVSMGARVGVRKAASAGERVSAQPKMQARVKAGMQPKPQTRAAAHPKAAVISGSAFYESRTVEYGPSGLSIDDEQRLGVIENLNEKFVSKDVEKRPLSDGKPLPEKDQAKEAKAKRLIGRKHRGGNEKHCLWKSLWKNLRKSPRRRKRPTMCRNRHSSIRKRW